MARLSTSVDIPNTEASSTFENLPPDWYIAQIIENKIQATKNDGEMLVLTWEILDGEYTGRKVWQNINHMNASVQAQEIAHKQLKSICNAIGYNEDFEDGDVLMFQACLIKIGLGKANHGYEARSEVKGVKALEDAAPETTAAKPAAAAKPATTTKAATTTARPAAGKVAVPGAKPWNKAGAAA